jgi:hypothetical protein
MRSAPPKPLEPDVRQALEVERVAVFAPEDAKARVLDRVTSTVGRISTSDAGDDGGRPGPAAPGTARRRTDARFPASPLWHVVSFGLGSVAGILFWRSSHAPQPPQIVYVERERPAASAPPPMLDAPLPAPTTSVPPPAQATGSSNVSPGNSLAAERTLLDIARSAFGRGEGDEALAALARHERLFPNGQLAEEREALAVRSLVLTQRIDQARARGARFRRRYPASVMLPAVEAALDPLP